GYSCFYSYYFKKILNRLLGVQKDESGIYRLYHLSYLDPEINFVDTHKGSPFIDTSGFVNLKIAQEISMDDNIANFFCFDNPYITSEEFNALSYDDKIITAEKIYEETGEDIVDVCSIAIACSPLYVDVDGKGRNGAGEELDIVDGKIVSLPNVSLDSVDILETEKLTGDVNLDGNVNMSDAVLIMQSLSNPNEYKLSEHGKINADYNGDGSVTALDALEIQMLMIS
ncbi:MAG: dockerin type I repeat-containing protein, partial [Ruminococcus sp.]|nr:dockerin type I repeat-containing protein [Ruminococcus sp.]